MAEAKAPEVPSGGNLEIRADKGRCLLRVRVTPKASRDEVSGIADGCLRVRIRAPPVEGAANDRTREFLSDILGIPRRDVTLERGQTAREKLFRIEGMEESEIRARIARFLP